MFAHMPIIRDIVFGAAQRGANLNNVCASLGLSIEELNDSGRSVPFESAYRTWELAVTQTGDPQLGLHLGETATPAILGLIGHLMQSSPDLLTAYQQVCRHAEFATDMFRYSIAVGDKETILTYQPVKAWTTVSPGSARQAVEQAMAGTLNVFCLLSGKKVSPVEAGFAYARPKAIRDYERIFGNVVFTRKENSLRFKTEELKLPVKSYDKSMFALFDKLIREKISALKRTASLSDAVRRILTDEFKGQIVPAGVVAGQLNMSVRTFQRKLNEEGSNYRDIASDLRKSFAKKLLSQRGVRVSEVARLLGYSEASALRKALKN